jgi:PAS domain S-box-containing protein
MTGTRSPKRRTEAAERQKVLRITRKVGATIGNDFFESLVKQLSSAVGADCVYLGELTNGVVNRIDTLAVCLNGSLSGNFEQDLPGTACAQVLSDGSFVCPIDVTGMFPLDRTLEDLQAQAYIGYRLSDSAGQVLGVLVAIYTHRLPDGEVARSVLEAFTPRAAAELERKVDYDALRKANERHVAFVASSMDAMWRIEFEKPIPVHLPEEEQVERIYRYGYMAECNDATARLANAPSVEDLVGARFAAIVPRDDNRLVEELRSAIRAGYRTTMVETMPLDPLGRRMYRLRSQFGIVENGELLRLWGTIRDITGLKRAELALEASERRSREMLERLPLPALVVDPSGQVVFANDALLQLGRWSQQELAAKNWFDILASDDSRDRWQAALLYSGSGPTVAHLEGPISYAEGPPRLVSWDTTLLLNDDNGVEGIAAIGTDITAQRAIEAQVRQAHKLEGIERLAAAVAHDFNNLLTVIIGETSILLGSAGELPDMHERLSAVHSSAVRCAGLTEQLLAVGRQQRLQPVILNLNSVIAGVEPVLRGLLGVNVFLHLQLESGLRPVNVDPAQMERVLINLVANARDAMPNGGQLLIATSNSSLDETSARAKVGPEAGPGVRLTVTDTGVGMSEDVLTRIFDPFFTTKLPGKGTGLGLSTVYGIVKQSGGSISVDTHPGLGATFTILLPSVKAPENSPGDSR